MAIVYRTTKGSELTFGEMDGNFQDLDQRIASNDADITAANTAITAEATARAAAITPLPVFHRNGSSQIDGITGDATFFPFTFTYTWATKPSAASVPVGTRIFISDIGGVGGSHWVAAATKWEAIGSVLVGQGFNVWSRQAQNTTVAPNADNAFVILASVVLKGGMMGANSKLRIVSDWDWPNSASTKYQDVSFGGTTVGQPSWTTGYVGGKFMAEVQNLNSLSSQKTSNAITYGQSSNARLVTSVNTALDVNIDFRARWGAAAPTTEFIYLIGYSVWMDPGNT